MNRKIIYVIFILILLYLIVDRYTYQHKYKCNFKIDKLLEGKEFLSKKNVIICGLARNSEQSLLLNRNLISTIIGLFNDYRFLVVENDSIDNTRNILLNWAQEDNRIKVLGCDGINLPVCKLNLKHYVDHEPDTKRIDKMSYLRNIYLDEIKKSEYQNFEYVIIWDLDIEGDLDIKGLYNIGYLLKNRLPIDAVCANGIMSGRYYDTYALRYKNNLNLPKRWYDYLYSKPYDCEKQSTDDLNIVKSCFGGLTIYNKTSIIQSRYGTRKDKYNIPICEHEFLHEKMNHIYQSSNLIYYVDKI